MEVSVKILKATRYIQNRNAFCHIFTQSQFITIINRRKFIKSMIQLKVLDQILKKVTRTYNNLSLKSLQIFNYLIKIFHTRMFVCWGCLFKYIYLNWFQ